jgi:hypothetical protein
MRREIWKIFFVWNFEKEEKWLNKMAAEGWQLFDVGINRYTFEEGAPGEYIYRLEMLKKKPENAGSVQYIKFIEDTGAEHIGTVYLRAYFRKKADGAGFDLFSDIDSRIGYLNRVLRWIVVLLGCTLCGGIYPSVNSFLRGSWLAGSIIPLLLIAFFGYGFLCVFFKRQRLKKEKILRE